MYLNKRILLHIYFPFLWLQVDFFSVTLGKYHSSSSPGVNKDESHLQSEHETTEQILRHEKSAAGILCQLKAHHGSQASHLSLTKDVLGVVATLGKVDDENLSRSV